MKNYFELPEEEGNIAQNSRRQTLMALGLSILLTAVYFYDVVFTDSIFADRDTLLSYMPTFKYWADRILTGEFPQWIPFDGLGQPFVGAMHGMAFHPIKLLFLLMNVGAAMKWATLLCYPLAFNGMFHLCRSLRVDWRACFMGALLFAFNGYMVSLTNNIPYLLGMASLPWCWWLTVRVYRQPSAARVSLAALSYAIMLFGGEPQTFVTACLTGCLFAFVLDGWQGRRGKAFLLYCGVMGVACLMCAVQWVPVLDVMRQSSPGSAHASEEAVWWSLHPFRFFDLFFDGFNGHSYLTGRWFRLKFYQYELANFWTRGIFFGFVGFVFCIFAFWKSRRAFFVLISAVVFSLLLCLGKYVGLYELLKVIPLFQPFRYPEKVLNVVLSALSILAAFGFSAFFEELVPKKALKAVFGAALGCLALFLAAEVTGHAFSEGILGAVNPSGEPVPEEVSTEVGGIFSVSLAMTLGTLVLLAFLRGRIIAAPAAFACCFALLMASSSHVYSPTFPEVALEPVPPVQILLGETAAGDVPRIANISHRTTTDKLVERGQFAEIGRASLMSMLLPNYGALYGVETLSSFLPAASKRVHEIEQIRKNGSQFLFAAGLFSARHFTVWGGDYAAMGGTDASILYEHPDLGALLVRMSGALPRAYLTRPYCSDDFHEFERAILAGSAIFNDFAFIEGCDAAMKKNAGQIAPPNADLGNASLVFRKPEHVAIDVDAHTDGSVLVLTDAYYSGWTATIDGSPAEILPANHAVRGVMMPKGKHRVEFKYRTPGLIPAAIVSLGTMLAALAASIILFIRRRKKNDSGVLSVQGEKA